MEISNKVRFLRWYWVWLVVLALVWLPGQPGAAQEGSTQEQDADTLRTLLVEPPQRRGWTEPILLGPGWFPDIAADPSGRVHVVWASTYTPPRQTAPLPGTDPYPGYDIVSYAAYDEENEWTNQQSIVALQQRAGSEVTRPAILIDEHGVFHMTFRDVTVYYSQASVYDAFSAQGWRKFTPLSVDQVGYFSDFAIDSKGTLHLAYTENTNTPNCSICYHVFYRYSTDGGQNWSIRTDISDLPTGAAKPQILLDVYENMHIVWEAGRGGSYGQLTDPTTVMYAASYDNGETWTRPREFVVPNGQAKNITIGEDGMGQLMVVWLALPEDRIYYQISLDSGRTWSRPEKIPDVWGGWENYISRLDDYHMALDSAGSLHLVAVGRATESQTALDVLHVAWNGINWLAPEIITAMDGDVPEWPRIAVANGNELHVTWFVRDEEHIFDSDRGEYTVWYARGNSSAPVVAPVVLPTFTPAPTPTVQELDAFSAPTPSPPPPGIHLTPVVPDVSASLYTELDEMGIIAIALVPAALLILLIFAFVRFRK